MPRRRSVPFRSQVGCTVCGGQHVILGTAVLMRQPVAFGGGEDQPDDAANVWAPWKLTVECPREGARFETSIVVEAHYDETVSAAAVEEVTSDPQGDAAGADTSGVQVTTPSAKPVDWVDEELREWRKSTFSTQRTFATTMLSTSSGGVAIYFAVLKYLGWERADFATPLVVLTVLPPALFLLAAVAFALALRPTLEYVDRADYPQFRATRIQRIHSHIEVGTALYLVALVLSILVFLAVLMAAS